MLFINNKIWLINFIFSNFILTIQKDAMYVDNIVYDICYNYLPHTKATSDKTLKFTTRHNGNTVDVFITRLVNNNNHHRRRNGLA